MLLNDRQITDLAEQGMIAPFAPALVSTGLSRGLSSFGYDVTLSDEFALYQSDDEAIDPHRISEDDVHRFRAARWSLGPGEFLLGRTVETVTLPRHVTGLVCDKSTYARCGITLQNTVIEAGFSGTITLEITNHNCRPVILRAGEGIAQILFLTGYPCAVSYSTRGGKYMNQVGVELPRVVS